MKLSAILMTAALIAAPAFADDVEHSDKTTVDHSKNPITGSRTTKVKRTHKHKDHGQDMESTSTETTKVSKDGHVNKDVKVEEKAAH